MGALASLLVFSGGHIFEDKGNMIKLTTSAFAPPKTNTYSDAYFVNHGET